jgi:hypothetical protein
MRTRRRRNYISKDYYKKKSIKYFLLSLIPIHGIWYIGEEMDNIEQFNYHLSYIYSTFIISIIKSYY